VRRVILSVLLYLIISISSAEYAFQTDWSGGGGIFGPVIDWGVEFCESSFMNWFDNPGSLLLEQNILENIIDWEFNGAYAVFSEDIDG
jgi:hypothetical protein